MIEKKFGLEKIENLKTKHIVAILEDMKNNKSASTLESYASAGRELARAIGKANLLPRDNASLGISRPNSDRCRPVAPAEPERMAEIRALLAARGEWLALAHDLRSQFGLRAKESLLSVEVMRHPDGREALAVRGAKGGRPREIPIRTDAQRSVVEAVQRYVAEHGQRSLIPPGMALEQAYRLQRDALSQAGARRADGTHAHAQRHAYAQRRIAEGASAAEVMQELGHGREDVIAAYVPR
jgi:site-specific recombinase XerD